MFEHLAHFDVVLITGPQRSGTTICTRMVAQDTGSRYVDEAEYGFHDEDVWRALITAGSGIAVHCPAMCHVIHEFAADERVAVIMMRRDLRDIIASQERIGWTEREEPRELAKYGTAYGPIALVKWDHWERGQRDLFPMGRRFEIEYESLAGHPLWIPRPQRTHFGHRQTR
jgi:hypothetical protein